MNQNSIELVMINRFTNQPTSIELDLLTEINSAQEIADKVVPFGLFTEYELYFKFEDRIYEVISVLTDTTCVIEKCDADNILKEFN